MSNKPTPPTQLTLLDEDYQELFGFQQTPGGRHSNTIELYDALPKYVYGRRPPKDQITLPSLTRFFNFRGKEFVLKISPARIKDPDGIERDYFPGKIEELVEDALRKLAAEGNGLMQSDGYSAKYSYYKIQKELKSVGWSYSIAQIARALEVCASTMITVSGEFNDTIIDARSPIFERITRRTRKDWKDRGKQSVAIVKFHDLVTRSIKSLTFRQIDYHTSMALHDSLARRLHKRMSHMYIQASFDKPYTISVARIFDDAGMKLHKVMNNNYTRLTKALEELKEHHVVMKWKKVKKIMDPQNPRRVQNIIVEISPHPKFIVEAKKANDRQNKTHNKARMLHAKNTNELP